MNEHCDESTNGSGDHDLQWWQSWCTWFYVIFMIIIVVFSTKYTDAKSKWYQSLSKPPGIPPGWVFGVVWSLLYTFLVVGAIIAAWDYNQEWTYPILTMYVIILLTTLFWCIGFFNLHDSMLGCIFLVCLLAFTGIMLWMLWPTNLEDNGVKGWLAYVPVVLYGVFGLWICCAFYFNVGVTVKN